jgi:hypothetical protein
MFVRFWNRTTKCIHVFKRSETPPWKAKTPTDEHEYVHISLGVGGGLPEIKATWRLGWIAQAADT